MISTINESTSYHARCFAGCIVTRSIVTSFPALGYTAGGCIVACCIALSHLLNLSVDLPHRSFTFCQLCLASSLVFTAGILVSFGARGLNLLSMPNIFTGWPAHFSPVTSHFTSALLAFLVTGTQLQSSKPEGA